MHHPNLIPDDGKWNHVSKVCICGLHLTLAQSCTLASLSRDGHPQDGFRALSFFPGSLWVQVLKNVFELNIMVIASKSLS